MRFKKINAKVWLRPLDFLTIPCQTLERDVGTSEKHPEWLGDSVCK